MNRCILPAALVLLLLACAPAWAAEQVTRVGVGQWTRQEKARAYKVTVDGEDIYLDGVLQKAKLQPDMDIAVENGEVVLVPKGQGLRLKPAPPK